MDLLLKKDNPGNVLEGSDQQLLDRAACGDDLTLFIESVSYDEYIIFGNYVVSADRVSALSLAHLDHGVRDPALEMIRTSQYIYDSRTNNVVVQELLDEGKAGTTVYRNNPVYRSYAWYSTRRYMDAGFTDLESLKSCGDQFKIRLELADDFKMVVRPDIVYFPYEGREYLVKSAAMLLPSELALDPSGYVQGGKPVTEHQAFSLAYVNIGSDNLVSIIHKQRFRADEKVDDHVNKGTVMRQDEGRTMVTRVQCDHTILIPGNTAC